MTMLVYDVSMCNLILLFQQVLRACWHRCAINVCKQENTTWLWFQQRGVTLILKGLFYLLSNIKEGCWWTDLLLRLKMTRAIHHVVKCSTAPREVGMLPTILKARAAGFQLLICPGFGAAEVHSLARIPSKECKSATHSVRLLISVQGVQRVQPGICVKEFFFKSSKPDVNDVNNNFHPYKKLSSYVVLVVVISSLWNNYLLKDETQIEITVTGISNVLH